MRRFLGVFLCLLFMAAGTVYAADAASADTDTDLIAPLYRLGVLDVQEPEAVVEKRTLINSLNAVTGTETGGIYFENEDIDTPLLYGQAVMAFIDFMGYTPYMDSYGYDSSSADGYIKLARNIKLISGSISSNKPITVSEYAKLMYTAFAETALPERDLSSSGKIKYNFDKNETLLSKYMDIEVIEGTVRGTDGASIDTTDGKHKDSVKIDEEWYNYNWDEDLFKYFGHRVKAFVNTEDGELRGLWIPHNKNSVVKINGEDIIQNRSTIASVSYYDENKSKKLSLSSDVDAVYNRELLTDFTRNDLGNSDAVYTFIDNDEDDKYDVVIIECYKSYVVYSVSVDSERILDTYGNIYDLETYFADGHKLYGVYNKPIELNVPVRYDVISYLEGKSGVPTYMKLSDKKAVGVFDGMRDNYRYIIIEGVEYECTGEYLNNREKRDLISTGDRVNAFLDCTGRIVDIKCVSTSKSAAYVMKAWEENDGEPGMKILDSDGTVKKVSLAGSVVLDGTKVSSTGLFEKTMFKKNNQFKPQLVLYKTNSKGEITYIDTADEVCSIGSYSNAGFTLDYNYEVNGVPRAVILNNELVIASKYIATMNTTTVFGVVTDSDKDCYVQSGTAFNNGAVLPTATDLNVKIYNVNDNYEPQYIVYEQSLAGGGWVDYWGTTYIIDRITEAINEDNEEVLEITMYNAKGRLYKKYAEDPHLKTTMSNSLSGDPRIYETELKDLPRGTVLFVKEDFGSIRSIAVQHIPREDGTETVFEKITGSSTSADYGINERFYNGKYLMSYGQVIARIEAGIVVNNHMPTDDEVSEGAVFPMPEWNRVIPLVNSDVVFLYDKRRDKLTIESADCILPGDMIFTKRSAEAYNGVFVYRD